MLILTLNIIAAQLTLGAGRTIPTLAAVAGLAAVVFGGRALARPASGRFGRPISLIFGLIGLAVGGLHAAYAAGGVGTGNGLAGAFVAIALGVIGIVLGALAFARARNTPLSNE